MVKNELRIDLAAFKLAMKRFRRYRRGKYRPDALMSFRDGFLSIEVDSEATVMNAEGEWHGRALINTGYLAALDEAPPQADPVIVRYQDGRLYVGSFSVGARWDLESGSMLKRIEIPDLIDLLALDRTLPRAEVHGRQLAAQITQAKREMGSAITRASKLLGKLHVSEGEIRGLVEEKIRERLTTG